MVGSRDIQSSGCPRAYLSSCHSQLSKAASWCLSPCRRASAGARSKALSRQFTVSMFPLPEPIRPVNIGICLCMLSKSSVPEPDLQKVPSDILKGFINIKKLSLPTAPSAKRQTAGHCEAVEVAGERVDEEEGSEERSLALSLSPPTPHCSLLDTCTIQFQSHWSVLSYLLYLLVTLS